MQLRQQNSPVLVPDGGESAVRRLRRTVLKVLIYAILQCHRTDTESFDPGDRVGSAESAERVRISARLAGEMESIALRDSAGVNWPLYQTRLLECWLSLRKKLTQEQIEFST